MTKNMVHRALATLVDQGFLVRDASGTRYELGFGVPLQSPYFPAPDFGPSQDHAFVACTRSAGERRSFRFARRFSGRRGRGLRRHGDPDQDRRADAAARLGGIAGHPVRAARPGDRSLHEAQRR